MKSRRVKLLIGDAVAGIGLLAMAPIAAAASSMGFGARDGRGPITGPGFGPADPPNRAGQTSEASDTFDTISGSRGYQYSLVAVAATPLRMERTDLVAELRPGKTIAQVANEHNIAPKTLVDAFVAARAEQLKTLITDGHMTQADADALLSTARIHATEQIEDSNTSNARRISSSWLTRHSTTIGGAYRTSITSPALHKPHCSANHHGHEYRRRNLRQPSFLC